MAIRRTEGGKQSGREDAERNIELQTAQSTGNKRPSNQISDHTEGFFYMCVGDKELPPAGFINTANTGTWSETFQCRDFISCLLVLWGLLWCKQCFYCESVLSNCTPNQALTPPEPLPTPPLSSGRSKINTFILAASKNPSVFSKRL